MRSKVGFVVVGLLSLQVVFWAASWHREFASAFPEVVRPVLNSWRAVAATRAETLEGRPYVLLVCDETWRFLSNREIRSVSSQLPQGWLLASEADAPAAAQYSADQCGNCSVVCQETAFSTPLLSVIDSSWWQGGLSAAGYRSVGIQVGPYFVVIRTWQTWVA